jgi:hypothetical protein
VINFKSSSASGLMSPCSICRPCACA